MKKHDRFSSSLVLSCTALIAANLVTAAGVLFWNWDMFGIMAVFWLENIVIGAAYILRLLTLLCLRRDFKIIAMILLFVSHFGLFAAGHGLFLMILFGPAEVSPFAQGGNHGSFIISSQIIQTIFSGYSLPLVLVALAGSHLVSFFVNFIATEKYKTADAAALMREPYGRVMLMHAALLLGFFVIMLFGGSRSPAIILLVVLKIAVDLHTHIKAHGGEENRDGIFRLFRRKKHIKKSRKG